MQNRNKKKKEREWKTKALELEQKYNKVNTEYTTLKDKDKTLDEKIEETRKNIHEEFKSKYESEMNPVLEENRKLKREKIENKLLKSEVLEKTTYAPADYSLIFGQYINDDGTFKSRSGETLYDPENPEKKVEDLDKAMEIIIKTHPNGAESITKPDVKSGFGSYTDKSANNTKSSEHEKVTMKDFNELLVS